jgi:hypothetical protein
MTRIISQRGLHVGGVAGADDIQASDKPCCSYGKDLAPEQVRERRVREEAKNGEGSEHAHQAGGDGGDRGGLGDGDPRPGVEEGDEVTISIA